MTSIRKKNQVLTVRISTDVKNALRQVAHAERRSLTNMIEVAVLEYCEKRGLPQKTALKQG